MPLWLDLLRTPMAAPETRALRRLRLGWQALCLLCSATAGFFGPLHRSIGRPAAYGAAVLLATTTIWSAVYLIRKHRADTAFLERTGDAA